MKCPFCDDPKELEIKVPGLQLNSNLVARAGKVFEATPHERSLIEILAVKYPAFVSIDTIVMWMWQGKDEPEGAANSVSVYAHKVRPKMGELGMRIDNRYGQGYALRELTDPWIKARPASTGYWTKEEVETLKQLCQEGKTIRQITAVMARAEMGVVCKIKKVVGRYQPKLPAVHKKWTRGELKELLRLREAGYDWEEIGEKLDRSSRNCAGRFHQLNIRGAD